MLGAQRAPAIILPALREDLRLHEGADGHFLIYDPMAHRYHEVSPDAFIILQNWRGHIYVDEFARLLSEKLARAVTPEEILLLARTMDHSGLLTEPMQGWKKIYDTQQKSRKNPLEWLLHNYLFIRIPLVKPDAFLQRTLPAASVLASKAVLGLIGAVGLLGLFLALRQWSVFTGTFLYFFSFEGAAGYLLALVVIKVCHELGHAYTARSLQCRVPTMGVAFMVLMPVLYTDVTDTWRLQSRKQRLIVSSAGMAVELAIAALAIFFWAVLPDGFLKSTAFFFATMSLISSLAINLSPLMRFDGYYILSDYWGISNLQPRSFALMRWKIREFLFNIGAPCPEEWSTARRIAVIIYAVSVCVYRLFLFVGIALLVYHMAFKLLGILLFAVEILWFVARPIYHELKAWWMMRAQIAAKHRYKISLGAAVAAVALFAIPWPHRIEIPAIIEPATAQRVVVPFSAQIAEINVKTGDTVKTGDVLFSLRSPKLDSDIRSAEIRLAFSKERYQRRISDNADKDASLVLEKEIAKSEEKIEGLLRQRDDLIIKAAHDGVVREVMADVHVNRWMQRGDELATVMRHEGLQVRGYVSEEFRNVLQPMAQGRFIPDTVMGHAVDVRLQTVANASADTVDIPYLTSTHGGAVAVNEDRERGSLPAEAQYQIVMTPVRLEDAPASVQRGVVSVEGQPASLSLRALRRMAAIVIRESGF